MSLDKGIKHGKEKRKEYRGSKLFDPSCRNNKGCPACEGNRLYQKRKLDEMSESLLKEYEEAFTVLAGKNKLNKIEINAFFFIFEKGKKEVKKTSIYTENLIDCYEKDNKFIVEVCDFMNNIQFLEVTEESYKKVFEIIK